jgi:hypothetical protein
VTIFPSGTSTFTASEVAAAALLDGRLGIPKHPSNKAVAAAADAVEVDSWRKDSHRGYVGYPLIPVHRPA